MTLWRLLIAFFACCVLLACVAPKDSSDEINHFCTTLTEVNSGSIERDDATDIKIQSLTTAAMLSASPPSLEEDWQLVHRTISAWSESISGERSMLDTFQALSSADLVSAQGHITDYIAKHCGVDLGGPQWRAAEVPEVGHVCEAWPRFITPLTSNHFPNLPDIAGSNYFAQNFLISKWSSLARLFGVNKLGDNFLVEPGGRVEFRGQFPKARYFAYHPNDMDLNNLPTLRDQDLVADEGSVNPFKSSHAQKGKNYYTANLVFSAEPGTPEPNTSYVGVKKDRQSPNSFLINMLRMYHVDAGNVPGSGEVPLPAMRIFDAENNLLSEYPECDPFPAANEPIATERVFPALPLIDNRADYEPDWSVSSNYEAPSDTMANADVQYVATTYSSRHDELLVVRARYLSAPDTRAGESVGAEAYQVRLYNICTYNFWNGAAIQCLLENELLRDENGYYTLIVSREEHIPSNLHASNATWFNSGVFLDGQLQYRYVYRENPYVQAIAQGVLGKPVAKKFQSYVPKAIHCSQALYESGGWQACFAKSAATDQ